MSPSRGCLLSTTILAVAATLVASCFAHPSFPFPTSPPVPPAMSTSPYSGSLRNFTRRQATTAVTLSDIFPATTYSSAVPPGVSSSTESTAGQDQPPNTATTTSSPSVPGLQPLKTPIPLAATMGLIMPDPWQQLYVGEYSSTASALRRIYTQICSEHGCLLRFQPRRVYRM